MVIVVGSGAGGATVARELALAGIQVKIIEKGPVIQSKKAFNYYDPSEEGIDLLKTSCVGGSTLVAVGNGVRVLENELKNMGLDISLELDEIEEDLEIGPMPDSHIGDGTKLLMESAKSMGLNIQKMPKFIRSKDCSPCGRCSFGCPKNAKWSAADFVLEAQQAGAEIISETEVTGLIVENGRIIGVKALQNSEEINFLSEIVILSLGGIETPRLLQKAGIEAGENFFMDTFITVGGLLENIGFKDEVQMNALIIKENFILGPHFSTFLSAQLKEKGATDKDILGFMVKIGDESSGYVGPDRIVKNNTLRDVRFLAEGAALAGAILVEAGVNPDTIISTHPRGAHPGGTAAIGDVVNENLETPIKNLFVADASVLPTAPGAPPLLTIMALSKRLAKHVISEYN
ncbi:MAG: GMC family oxidoreductase N-terminal domain-containing protein [Methanobacteriaceae archaeon]|jgi:choline dehydrogenase-like flavoprotein|nr:GMC family oxidoreductase N-terminal domain-containing protein [Methanobacteriaceae archaeon]MDO9626912.1 GMC family oxidoreductase N-terminal domain-containing protein [Methanobacteriaceae archaeon]